MLKNIVIIGAVLILIAAAAVTYAFLKPTDEASAPIAAVPLAQNTATTVPTIQIPDATTTSASTSAVPAATATVVAEVVAPVTGTGPRTFQIDPVQSEARFLINEVLNGQPKTVIGVTNQVSGQLAVDPAAPASTTVGVIQVNARTLTTDSEFRNRAIKNRVLLTNEHEFITFTPAQITGMPSSAAAGDTLTFQITGDLTIIGVTRPVTFDVQVQAVSDTQITGQALGMVLYKDFGISIPEVPSVTGVEDQVRLEIDFVANALP